ncbi:secondary thiamine-phosphate synthase enzyme YjbQ [Robiginitalea aurantiaca]|uniref:Secondary thiamine-phosphate synthase enzyme YjbQ n=1 Tax=Robiginitalea aurantiaca TaxID=3056915 RepID=A0ABT7WI98_9FLAO|nr:secondary thiamine-phosphate synthase enzyme YjbQ [Robiginitalea aurantiaca]MDM9632644.1 secondary thiamine-phosphate synthase enzyme YjbQ [Robiginitalea aurantiaca]
MTWLQREFRLQPYPRGFHLVTTEIERQLPELQRVRAGLLHIFIKHTSASLTLNENADASVRHDFEAHMNEMVPENQPYYTHTFEGSDDMPAHIKASLMGSSVMVPVSKGRLNLGIWQGVYLCEHRDHAGGRTLLLTLQGE